MTDKAKCSEYNTSNIDQKHAKGQIERQWSMKSDIEDVQRKIEDIVAMNHFDERAPQFAPQSEVKQIGFIQAHKKGRHFHDKKGDQDQYREFLPTKDCK